jgi:hypothetical protein
LRLASFSLAALLSAPLIQAGPAYILDDGTRENTMGVFNTSGVFSTIANRFTVVPGGQLITNVSIFWDGIPENLPLASPITVKLWNDPNGDGDPSDAILQDSVAGVSGTGWVSYNIGNQVVLGQPGSNFFVGFSIPYVQQTFFGSIDETLKQGKSWLSYTNSLNDAILIDTTRYPGNWMIRANWTDESATVPEPATILLSAAGLALLAFKRR